MTLVLNSLVPAQQHVISWKGTSRCYGTCYYLPKNSNSLWQNCPTHVYLKSIYNSSVLLILWGDNGKKTITCLPIAIRLPNCTPLKKWSKNTYVHENTLSSQSHDHGFRSLWTLNPWPTTERAGLTHGIPAHDRVVLVERLAGLFFDGRRSCAGVSFTWSFRSLPWRISHGEYRKLYYPCRYSTIVLKPFIPNEHYQHWCL